MKETSSSSEALEPRSGLSHAAIREQLDRIFASREFQATARVRDFLQFIVDEALAGRADQLKGYTIATAVFDRSDDFDPAQDPIVRIQAGLLRRALERYYLVAGTADPVLIDVPKGAYVPIFRAKAPAAGAGDSATGPISREGPRADLARGPAVAIFPLDNLTPDPERLFFATGLAEELASELGRYQDLTVVPCHRSAAGAGTDQDRESLCRSSGARFALRGSIRCDAETAKVAVQLLDMDSGRQIWTRSFRFSLAAAALIETQEEIAHEVAGAVASEYGVITRRLTAESRKKSPAELSTYEAMLRYHSYQIAPSSDAVGTCLAALQTAAEREPDYGPVWSALATLHCQMYSFDAPGFDDPLATGLAQARRGVALEPGRQISRMVLAYASLLAGDLDVFGDEAETALSLNPENPYVSGTIGYLMICAGGFERGGKLLDRAMEACPFHPTWFHHGVYLERYRRGDYQGALDAVKSIEALDFWHPAILAAAFGKLERPDDAAPFVSALLDRKPDFPDRARELIARPLKVPSLCDDFVDGLRRAGVAIPDA
jgi:adenylate cyclase